MAKKPSAAGASANSSPSDHQPGKPVAAHPDEICSLDDLVSLLLQLEPSDHAELTKLHGALMNLAGSAGAADTADMLLMACSKIGEVLQGASTDPAAALIAAGQFLGEAMLAVPEQARGPVAAPILPPRPEEESETLPDDADLDLLNEFITESRDYIEGAEAALLSLETDYDNQEAVNTIFRAFHTIKGTSGFLGLKSISQLAHRAESLLSRVRDREIRCTGGYADLSLRSVDSLKELLKSVQSAIAGKPMIRPEGYGELLEILANPEAAGVSSESGRPEPPPRLGDILVAEGTATREVVENVAANQGDLPLGVALVKSEATTVTNVAKALRTQQKISTSEKQVESSVRVRTDRLDRLIDMVGELVIAQSMVAQDQVVHQSVHHELLKKVTHAGKIVRELQDLTMSMRMVPLKNAFQKMARLVRDLAHKSGKSVDFVTEGEDTEIDRNMVDVVSDPLVHMVRNAIDHGIEPADKRAGIGKPGNGTVRLAAYHAGGNVVLELQDDGKGLDREKILNKAIAQGLIDADKCLTDSEVFNLIFAPGFSTADTVTDISGRGVGMDVVRRGVEALRGRIEIASVPGNGCTFTIRLPLTLAITDGMLVKVGNEKYIIPTVNIHLSFRPEPGALSTVSGRGEMVILRGELMPIFRLHRLFSVADAVEDPTQGLLVVVGDGLRRCTLLVDQLLGQQQVVAKTLGAGLGKVHAVSGGAILGDGRVGLILDPAEIIALARQAA
jgi:two-component system chemotaxis sensor kinase CheA